MKQPSTRLPLWWTLKFAAKTSPWLIFATLVTSFVYAIIPAAYIWVIQYVVKATETSASLVLPLVIAVTIYALSCWLKDIKMFFNGYCEKKLRVACTDKYLHALTELPPSCFNDGELMSKVRAARNGLNSNSIYLVYSATINITTTTISIISLAISLALLDPKVAIVAFLAPIPLVINYKSRTYFHAKLWPTIVQQFRRLDYFSSLMKYQRTGVELASLRGLDTIASKAKALSAKNTRDYVRFEVTAALVELVSSVFTVAIFAFCLYTLVTTLDIAVVVGALSGLMSYLNILTFTGFELSRLASNAQPTLAIKEFLGLSKNFNFSKAQRLVAQQSLQINNVNVHYGNFQAVKDVSLQLRKGGFTALVGVNGCGKTSLIKAIMGGQTNATGTITCDTTTVSVSDHNYYLVASAVQQEYGRF